MGGCCSVHVSFVGKVHDDVDCESNLSNQSACHHDGARVLLKGSSKIVSMYSQKGSKSVNQDSSTVWEDFTGRKDMVFCGLFDGHGPLGHKFSQCIRDNLPSKLSAAIKQSQQKDEDEQDMSFASWEGTFMRCFSEMDEDLAKKVDTAGLRGGSTCVSVIKQDDQLIVGNLGDSRAVLCRRAQDNNLIPVQLTVDMTPDAPGEALRITNSGGRIFAAKEDPSVNRVWVPEGEFPGLAMTRAFGNFCLKDYGVTSVPDVSYRKLTEQDEFVVLASDGIWDVLTNSEAINIVASAPKRSMAAKLLVNRAVQGWRCKHSSKIDDCTAICLFLKD